MLSGYDTDISNLQSSKQDVIDVNNKLNISNVDISASNIRFADFGSSISTKFTSLDNSISTFCEENNIRCIMIEDYLLSPII